MPQLDMYPNGQPQGGLTESAAWRIVTRGILFTFGLALGLWLLYHLLGIVAQIIVAVIVAAGMTPLVDRISGTSADAGEEPGRWRVRRPPRALAVLLLFLLLFLISAGAVAIFVPPIVDEMEHLVDRLPEYVASFQAWLADLPRQYPFLPPINFSEQLTAQASAGAGQVGKVVGQVLAVVELIFSLTFILFMALYMTADSKRIRRYMVGLFPPDRREQADVVMLGIGERLGGWVRGQLLLCAIIGVLILAGLGVIGVRYAFLLAFVAAVGELVPVVGPIISAIPAVLIASLHSPFQGGLVLMLYIVVQQIENYIVVPKVMERAVSLHPLVVLVALIAGTELYGITGAILSVPVAAALSVVVIEIRRERSVRLQLKKQALEEYASAAAEDPEVATAIVEQAAATIAATPPRPEEADAPSATPRVPARGLRPPLRRAGRRTRPPRVVRREAAA